VANVVVSALATWNGKALKKGQKDISAFDKSVKSLGKTFAGVFGAYQLLAFSKKAINAFAADEKAAKSLAVQLENTGNAFRIAEVETYIAGLQKLYGVLDDQLRPAFQTLLNATGSVTLSQEALETALNVSAGTGKDLGTVVAAIAKGAAGTTTSIARLGTGLDKATIATGDMNKIMAALDAKFKGQALARLETYAGKMDLLKAAAADATEIIGKGLIDALSALAKDNSIDEATDSMNQFALAIADTVRGLGLLVGEVKKFADSDVGKLLGALAFLVFGSKKLIIGGALALIGYDIGKSNAPGKPNVGGYSGIPDLRTSQALLKARKEEYNIITKKNAIENKNVEELKKKFDLERIGLTTALNQATDEETKLRLKAQLAILDNNEALAKKLLAELEAAEALKKLAEQARLAGMSIEEYTKSLTNKYDLMITDLIKQFKNLGLSLGESMALANMSARYQAQADAIAAGRGPSGPGSGPSGPGSAAPLSTDPYDILIRQLAPQLNTQYGLPAQDAISLATMSARYQAQADAITINIQAGGDKMSQAIAESIQIANRNGYDLTGAGQLP
jgi:DNA-binding phage protein